ncbi:MAG TPA: hypothetical protein VHE34_08855 [Puia sp.]|uniref:hypothetical protein n=1 Tax=Puia sp. TaxID=2045100 RepID=UPI002C5220EB|nr:hypothetical protein [Puia sp.]HVU95320.1 hypothetical protein [Puia sp.]
MAPKGKKSDARVPLFRELYWKIRAIPISNDMMAARLNMGAANLSSYASAGGKTPGPVFLKKFFLEFKPEIVQLGYKLDYEDTAAGTAGDPPLGTYAPRAEEFARLLDSHKRLSNNFDKIVETQRVIANSNDRMSKSNYILAITTKKVVDRLHPDIKLGRPYRNKKDN